MSDKANDPVSECRIDLRLHCFPAITAEDSCGAKRSSVPEDCFQRSYRPAGASGSGDAVGESGIKRTHRRTGYLPPEQAEALAYSKGLADGKKEGLAEGEKRGFEVANSKMQGLIQALHQALEQVQSLRSQIVRELENEAAELALAIARKVIRREAATDHEIVKTVVRKALQQCEHPGRIKIKLNPTDLEAAEEAGSGFSDLTANLKEVQVEADASITAGGCLIETDCGAIDARIEQQLQVVEDSFHDEIKRSGDRS